MQPNSAYLARNSRRLREERGLSQRQMAKRSGIPRSSWASLESASALQISIEELFGPPRSVCEFFPAVQAAVKRRGGAAFAARPS